MRRIFFTAISCLLLTFMVAGLAGCAKKDSSAVGGAASSEGKAARTRTIVDQVGHTVHLPEKIDRVVIASVWPLASVYCQMFGTDKLVGLDPAIVSAAENSMLIQIAPDIGSIETGFSKNVQIKIYIISVVLTLCSHICYYNRQICIAPSINSPNG